MEAQRRGKPFRDADGTISYPSYRTRPKPDFTLDPFHRGLLTASVAAAVLASVYTLLQIPSMPEEVPIHWSGGGTVSYRSRGSIAWPILLVMLCVHALCDRHGGPHAVPAGLQLSGRPQRA